MNYQINVYHHCPEPVLIGKIWTFTREEAEAYLDDLEIEMAMQDEFDYYPDPKSHVCFRVDSYTSFEIKEC